MRKKHSVIALILLTLAQVLAAPSLVTTQPANEGAVKQAMGFLGLVSSGAAAVGYTRSVSEVTLADSLARVWTGVDTTMSVLRVTLRNVRLKGSHYRATAENEESRDFEVFVDSATEIIYRIVSRSEHYDSAVIRKPSPSSVNHRTVFSSAEPTVPLLDALDQAAANPFRAMEIDAALVMGRYGSDTLKPVWEIHMYGVEHPGSQRGKDRPIYQRNHCMSIIDATSGQFLLGTN